MYNYSLQSIYRYKVLALLVCLLGMVLLSSCSQDDSMPMPQKDQMEGGKRPLILKANLKGRWTKNSRSEYISRGTPTNFFYETFGLFGAEYDAGNAANMTMNYMYDEECDEGMGAWQTVLPYNMPEISKHMTFFAYYPFQNSSVYKEYIFFNGGNADRIGEPYFDYIIPDSVILQPDLMVARTEILSDSIIKGDTIKLKFKHLLTAVRFTVDASVPKGRIKSISIDNVASGGTYTYDNDSFVPHDTLRTYKMNADIVTTGTSAVSLADNQAFLMMPQYLTENSSITIVFDNGRSYRLKKTLEEVVWEPGKIVTYNIKITSLKELILTTTIEPWEVGTTFNWNSSY